MLGGREWHDDFDLLAFFCDGQAGKKLDSTCRGSENQLLLSMIWNRLHGDNYVLKWSNACNSCAQSVSSETVPTRWEKKKRLLYIKRKESSFDRVAESPEFLGPSRQFSIACFRSYNTGDHIYCSAQVIHKYPERTTVLYGYLITEGAE